MTAGIPGFFTYWYLNQIGYLNYSDRAIEEKKNIQIILSFINLSLSIFVWFLLKNKGNLESEVIISTLKIVDVIMLFFISFIITVSLTIIVYPKIIKCLMAKMEKFRIDNNLPLKTQETVFEMLVHRKKYKYTHVFIFDFDENFIESGYLGKFSTTGDSINISLETNTFHTKEKVTYIELLEKFNDPKMHKERKEIYLDFDKKLKIFFFYANN